MKKHKFVRGPRNPIYVARWKCTKRGTRYVVIETSKHRRMLARPSVPGLVPPALRVKQNQ